MTAPVAPLAIYNIMKALGVCVLAKLAATDAGAPARVCTALAGTIADDDCCDGQLAISVSKVYPARTPPQEASGDDSDAGCGPPLLVADLTVRVSRCAPVVNDQGAPPTCDALDRATQTWFGDVAAVRQALGCCLRDMVDAGTVDGYGVGAATASGPEGDCLASDTALWVSVPACLCPDG